MISELTNQFFFLVTVGAAVGIVGAVRLVATKKWGWALAAGAAALPLGLYGLYSDDRTSLLTAVGLVAGGVGFMSILGSRSFAAMVGSVTVRWGGLAAIGVGTVVVAGIRYDKSLENDSDQCLQQMELVGYQPALEPVVSAVVTDRGKSVEVKRPSDNQRTPLGSDSDEVRLRGYSLLMSVIRLAPADDTSNCHGWVFTQGQYWVGGLQVDPILNENGYFTVKTPKVGDLVIYRDGDGKVTHTALIRATPDGLPVLVESKWGCLGTFLHPVDKSPYGTAFDFYHSNRAGHLLAGLTSPGGSVKISNP